MNLGAGERDGVADERDRALIFSGASTPMSTDTRTALSTGP
jgi:hypothetical protein